MEIPCRLQKRFNSASSEMPFVPCASQSLCTELSRRRCVVISVISRVDLQH
ncbi:hypothetical protein J6590_053434 [Homalodisca vitripennis]|nr:hypothetical protein J6590_053434 [Homalodisca vitripennis]